MTEMEVVVEAVRPRESVTVAVKVTVPAAVSTPVRSVVPDADHPPPEMTVERIDEPCAPAAPESVTRALPMPLTYMPVPEESSATAAESVPAVGRTDAGTVSVIETDFVPSNVLPEYVSQ